MSKYARTISTGGAIIARAAPTFESEDVEFFRIKARLMAELAGLVVTESAQMKI